MMKRATGLKTVLALGVVGLLACEVGGDLGTGNGNDSDSADAAEAASSADAAQGVETITCTSYCAAVTSACTGANAQYESATTCEAYCRDVGAFAIGASGDSDINTVACRQFHAGAADGDPVTHCAHAGPTGAGACGSWCDNYCELAVRACGGVNALYGSRAECDTACAGFATTGQPGDADGDTVQCRIYHLGAAMADPTTHCVHAGSDGGGVCVAP